MVAKNTILACPVNTTLALDHDYADAVWSGMGERPKNRIAELRAALGWTQEQLANAVQPRTSQPQIMRLETGERNLTQTWMERLAKALRVKPGDLLPGESSTGAQPRRDGTVDDIEGSTRNLNDYIRPALKVGARDVPIWGYAIGGDGAHFIDQGVRLGMAYRPNALEGVPDAFAIEIWDHSMHPALKHGHQALVHPNKRPEPGDDVLVTLRDGQALVKELVRRSEKLLVLKQYNPPKEIKIEGNKVAKIQLIVDSPRVRI